MPRQLKHTAPVLEGSLSGGAEGSLLSLEEERDRTLGSVRDLEEAARSIRVSGFTARSFETISSIATDLDDGLRRHEELEETLLFPELRKTDPGIVRSFTEEHRAARVLFTTLRSIIRDIEGGRIHGGSVGDLLRTIGELVTILRRHIIHEGDVLAPFIRQKSREEHRGYHGY